MGVIGFVGLVWDGSIIDWSTEGELASGRYGERNWEFWCREIWGVHKGYE